MSGTTGAWYSLGYLLHGAKPDGGAKRDLVERVIEAGFAWLDAPDVSAGEHAEVDLADALQALRDVMPHTTDKEEP